MIFFLIQGNIGTLISFGVLKQIAVNPATFETSHLPSVVSQRRWHRCDDTRHAASLVGDGWV